MTAELASVLDRVWRLLDAAVADRNSALHAPVVATTGQDGPDARAMVLRRADRASAGLVFYSDVRAGKIATLTADPRAVVTGYDGATRLQLRLAGRATVTTSGPDVDAAWSATGPFSRRAYMTTLPPGTPLAGPASGLPDAVEAMPPSQGAREAGRPNFALVTVVLHRIEWLCLADTGQRHAVHVRDGTAWTGHWLVP